MGAFILFQGSSLTTFSTVPFVNLESDEQATGCCPADKLAQLLHQHGVRTVSFNSCDSANAAYGNGANLAAVSRRYGISNVLGMSAQISTTAVGQWSSSFYRRLIIQGRPIHEAAALSRRELRDKPLRRARAEQLNDATVRDWPIPTVYTDGQKWKPQSDPHKPARSSLLQSYHSLRFSKAFARQPSFVPGYSFWWRDDVGRIYKDGQLDDDYQALVCDTSTKKLQQAVIEAKDKIVYLHGPADVDLVNYVTYLIRLWVGSRFVTHAFLIDCTYFKANWAFHLADHIRHFFLRDSICHLHKRLTSKNRLCRKTSPCMVVIFQNVDVLFPRDTFVPRDDLDKKRLARAQIRFHTMLRKLFECLPLHAAEDSRRAPHVMVQGKHEISWLRSQEGPLGDAVPFLRDLPGDICSLLCLSN